MTQPRPDAHGEPNLDDVIDPTESAPRDRHEHGKASSRPDVEALAHRTEQERVDLGLDDYDPDTIPAATD